MAASNKIGVLGFFFGLGVVVFFVCLFMQVVLHVLIAWMLHRVSILFIYLVIFKEQIWQECLAFIFQLVI